MFTPISKVLAGVVTCLVIISSIFFFRYHTLSKENIILNNTVATVRSANNILKEENRILKSIQDISDKELEARESSQKELNKNLKNIKTELTKRAQEIRNDKNSFNEATLSDSLDPDIARMLNELCDRVRENPCSPSE